MSSRSAATQVRPARRSWQPASFGPCVTFGSELGLEFRIALELGFGLEFGFGDGIEYGLVVRRSYTCFRVVW